MKTQNLTGVLALVFALTGCGGGGGSSTTQTPTSSPTNPTITNPTTTTPVVPTPTPTPTPTPVPGATYTVSGTVSGGTVSGVTIIATPGGASATTNSGGSYVLKDMPAGSYTVTPSYSGVTFTPGSTNVSVTNGTVTGVNFSDPLPVLKEGSLVYGCNYYAICKKNLATSIKTTVLQLGEYLYPSYLAPFTDGRIAYEGGNMDGIYTISMAPGAIPIPAITGSGMFTPECGIGGSTTFSVVHTKSRKDVALIQALCHVPGMVNYSNFFIVEMDNSWKYIQITNDNGNESSPVMGAINSDGKAVVLYVKSPAKKTGSYAVGSTSIIMSQEIDLPGAKKIGIPTVFESDAVNADRGLSLNATRTKVAFVKYVSDTRHIFVKSLTVGKAAEIDIGPGNNPYWSKYKIGESSLILYTVGGGMISPTAKLYAVSPDGLRHYSVPIPNGISVRAPLVVFAPLS